MESKPVKKTDHGPLDPKLKARSPNAGGRAYPNPGAAQDLGKKSDSEQPRGSGGT